MRKRNLLIVAAATVFLAQCVMPRIAYGNPLAARAAAAAAERLTDQVMRGIEPKIREMVDNAAIPPAAKEEIARKLTEAARRIVKTQIDGAVGGRLPNPAQVTNQALNELRRLADDLIRSATPAGVAAAVAAGAPAPAASQPAVHAASGSPAAAPISPPAPAPPREKPRLAIRPFTCHSEGDSEIINTLFSIQRSLLWAFNVADGSDAAADYELHCGYSGNLANHNLFLVAIADTRTNRIMAGGYRLYRNIEEIPVAIPAIANGMAAAAREIHLRRPNLMVVPFSSAEQAQAPDTDTEFLKAFALMLPIAVANTGKYAVQPRDNSVVRAAFNELHAQKPDAAISDRAKAIGAATSVEHVLFAETRTFGNMNMLIMRIHKTSDGSLIAGESLNFYTVEDGVAQLPQIIERLTRYAPAPAMPTPAPVSTPTPRRVPIPEYAVMPEPAPTPPISTRTVAPREINDTAMVFVEGGTFTMGCAGRGRDCGYGNRPAHSVTVDGFYIMKYEVTQRLWKEVMDGANPSHFKGDDLPVERVSWNDVQMFISRLNSITGKRYRLPTEAEWEYAARGGNRSGGFTYSGSNGIGDVAWHWGNSGGRPRPVGTKQANELGIHDMSGSVWEWVSDWYGDYTNTDKRNPAGPSRGINRVRRGGSWRSDVMAYSRVSSRFSDAPDTRSQYIGFRLVIDSPPSSLERGRRTSEPNGTIRLIPIGPRPSATGTQ